MNPHHAEHVVTIGLPDAASEPYATRLDIDPASVTDAGWLGELSQWLADHVHYAEQSLTVFVAPEHSEGGKLAAKAIARHYQHARQGSATLLANAENQARNFVHGLTVLSSGKALSFSEALPSMDGHTCVVVGAGPSLDDDIEALKLHRGPILAVNTSVGALALHGIKPTAVVVMESRDIREGLRLNTTGAPLLLTLSTHPNNWPADGSPALCFADDEPNMLPYARDLGMYPVACGASCTTAAVSIALLMGARVVLVGQDCAYADDGRMYAKGTPYQDVRATFHDADHMLTFHKLGKDHADHMHKVPGVRGTTARTSTSMLSFAMWFASMPDDIKARVVNCTSGGARIDGVLDDDIANHAQTTHAYDHAIQDTAEARRTHRAASIIRTLAHAVTSVFGDCDALIVVSYNRLLACWSSAEMLRMKRDGAVGAVEYQRRVAQTVRRGCADIAKALHAAGVPVPTCQHGESIIPRRDGCEECGGVR